MKTTRHYQKGDAGAGMLVLMVVLMVGWLWHGGDHGGHMSGGSSHLSGSTNTMPSSARTDKNALEFLDESYARGEITRDEYMSKREDLTKR